MLPNERDIQERFDDVIRPVLDRCRKPTVTLLNAEKPHWASFYPYTLTIRNPEHVIDFMQGSFFLYVIIDLDELSSLYASYGYIANVDLDNPRPIRLTSSAPNGFYGEMQLGARTFSMLPMEFVSLSSFARVTVEYIATAMKHPEIRKSIETGMGLSFQ